jgi:phospholipid/cholesterol/gamma-HCH transport system substrate-binding protein
MANVHSTTSTLNEDLKAAQSNFLLRGFFKKKEKQKKAKQDSVKKAQEASAAYKSDKQEKQ